MRVIGIVEGVEVKFDFYPPNTFKGVIPKRMTGKYIIQFKVIDAAGNESSRSDLFIYIDFRSMDFKVIDPNDALVNQLQERGVEYMQVDQPYAENTIMNIFDTRPTISDYSFKELIQ